MKTPSNPLLLPSIIFLSICCTFFIILWGGGIYPFGDKSFLLWDGEIQYVDYFAYLKDVLSGEANIAYSFSKSLGGSLVALYGYYLVSPLNVLVVFFANEQLPLFVVLVTTLKLGLSGITASIFLKVRFERLKNSYVFVLSVAYGLMQYNMMQMSNIMWLDGVMMLPIVLLAVYRYVTDRKSLMLFLSVAVSIVLNWYTAYMICIFAVLYYLCERILKKGNLFVDFIKFCGVMALGVGASAFLFFPVIRGLMGGKEVLDIHAFAWDTHGRFIDIFRGFVPGSYEATVSLYCGLLFLLFAVFYFLCKKIGFKEKVVFGTLLFSMLFSCYAIPLESIWSGMRYVGSYPFRFGFCICFLILFLAARALEEYDMKNDWKIFCGMAAAIISALLLFHFQADFYYKNLIASIVIIIIYAVLFFFLKKYPMSRGCFHLILCIVLIGEMALNGILIVRQTHVDNRDVDVFRTYVKEAQEQVQAIKTYDPSEFYRMETTSTRGNEANKCTAFLNEPLAYDYPGVTHYSSAFDSGISQFISDLGYAKDYNFTMFGESLLPSDSLFGIKYVMSNRQELGYERVPGIKPYNGKDVYYNPYALGLGMAADAKVLKQTTEQNSFEMQNQLYSKLAGMPVELFKKVKAEAVLSEGILQFVIPPLMEEQKKALIFGYADTDIEDMTLSIDGMYRCDYQAWLSYPTFQIGDGSETHTVDFANYSGRKDELQAEFYYLDMELFEEVTANLQDKGMTVEEFEDGYIKGIFQAEEDGYLLLTVPFDSNWEIRLNGETVKGQRGLNELTAIKVGTGSNRIEMKYHVPGVKTGVFISLLSVAGFLLFESKRSKYYKDMRNRVRKQ